MDASATISVARQDARVLGLISTGHFMSHFYSLTLPPLFPFLKDAFDVSYTQLGVMMALIGGATAVKLLVQHLAGQKIPARFSYNPSVVTQYNLDKFR